MNELINKDSITTLELLKQINIFREQEGNRAELKHKTLLEVVRDEFEEEIGQQKILLSSYKNSQNKEQPMYILTLNQAKQILVRESKFVRKAMIHYIEELEKQLQSQFRVPKTFKEALQLALEQQERIEALELKQEEDRPKVEFYDDVTDSKDTVDMGTVAKVLNIKGVGRNKLFEILRGKKILMSNNQPYQKYIDSGWFRQIESKFNLPNGDIKINIKTVVFQKGVDGIRKVLKELE